MTDRDSFELDTSAGMQPQSGLGDRILVGLAVAVLLGGALIAVGNALPDPDEVAQASSEEASRPERTPRPSPTPAPPRVAGLEEPDVEFSPPGQSSSFSGWIRALSDLVVWSSLDENATEIGVLKEGDIAYADQAEESGAEPGWLLLQDPYGWIKSLAGGTPQVRRYEYPTYRYSGWVGGISAGPRGFVAQVNLPTDANSYPTRLTGSSIDGGSWRSSDASFVDSWNGGSIAWGPAGWLAATYVIDGSQGRVLIWSSSDGLAWARLGMLGGVNREYVWQLHGSADGYLLETYPEQGTSSSSTIWSSPDGQTWQESTDPLLEGAIYGQRQIAALQHGFYLWNSGADPAAGGLPFGAFSLDGQTWTAIESVPDGVGLQLTELDGRIVAIDLNPATMAPRVWTAAIDRDEVSWIRESASEAAFTGGVVRQLVSDGTRAFAFGWDRTTEEPLVWTGDGVHWLRGQLPQEFGGIPTLAAAGPTGVVVVGQRHTLRGDNPIFWHRTATGGWIPESEPLLAVVPDPAADECPELPVDVLEYTVVDAAGVASCHGDAPITFRAFSVACSDCWGTMGGDPQPAWLLNPVANQLFLAPKPDGGWSGTAILAPSLAPLSDEWTNTWVEVTGHYDDPAAMTCRVEPTADEIGWWSGPAAIIDQCRMTFVVTAVRVVDGP